MKPIKLFVVSLSVLSFLFTQDTPEPYIFVDITGFPNAIASICTIPKASVL